MNLKRYAADSEETRVQTEAQSVVDSRTSCFGIVPIDALKTMDKKQLSIIADATLDEVIDTINHLFVNYPLCDNCEEPATKMGFIVNREDRLDPASQRVCDSCRFSRGVDKKSVRPTEGAEAIHRAKSLICKLQDRR